MKIHGSAWIKTYLHLLHVYVIFLKYAKFYRDFSMTFFPDI